MKILITGITGTLGTAVTRQLLADHQNIEIIGYSRDELRQKQFLKDERITLVLGCVRDKARLVEASRGCDMILHFAALKHVDLLEDNPDEALKTNLSGTDNVLHAQRINKIGRVVMASTDKAVEPINVYGASKFIAERLVLRNKNNVVCRYGNVIASNGSVIPMFVRSIRDESKAYVTHEKMTRFWIRIEDAAKFVISCAFGEKPGLHIPPMKAAKVIYVAGSIASILDKESIEIDVVGVRPGEKLHESLVSRHDDGRGVDSADCEQFEPIELRAMLKDVVESLK